MPGRCSAAAVARASHDPHYVHDPHARRPSLHPNSLGGPTSLEEHSVRRLQAAQERQASSRSNNSASPEHHPDYFASCGASVRKLYHQTTTTIGKKGTRVQ